MRAVEKWDKNGGASFSTYAVPWINCKLRLFIKNNQNAFKFPAQKTNTYSQVEMEKLNFMLADDENSEEKLELESVDRLLEISEEVLTDQ